MLIIAALNLVRVEVAPLPRPHDLPPLAFLLAQQQVWYEAMALQQKLSKRYILAAVLPKLIDAAQFVCTSILSLRWLEILGLKTWV